MVPVWECKTPSLMVCWSFSRFNKTSLALFNGSHPTEVAKAAKSHKTAVFRIAS
jgi:hypothetical protein